MALRVFKGLWLCSFLLLFGSLLYVYAGLPQQVLIQNGINNRTELSREVLFYSVLLLSLLVNVLVYIVRKIFAKELAFRVWFHGLIVTINLFFIFALFLISATNSGERVNFSNIGMLAYGSVGLIIIWVIAWPLYLATRKFSAKEEVI